MVSKTKVILYTFLKTSLCIILCLGFFVPIFVGLAPNSAFKIANDLGIKNVAIKGYEKLYIDNSNFENLYNLVNVSSKYEEYSNVEKYAKIFVDDNSQEKFDFIEKFDESAKSASSKTKYAYVASVENYFLNCYIVALFNNNKTDDATNVAIMALGNTDVRCFGLGTCVDFAIQNENFGLVKNIAEMDFAGKSIFEKFDEKIAIASEMINNLKPNIMLDEENKFDVLALLSCKRTILATKYLMLDCLYNNFDEYNTTEMQNLINDTATQINNVNVEYNNLEKI